MSAARVSGGRERSMECGKRDRPLGKNTGCGQSMQGCNEGRPRPTWN